MPITLLRMRLKFSEHCLKQFVLKFIGRRTYLYEIFLKPIVLEIVILYFCKIILYAYQQSACKVIPRPKAVGYLTQFTPNPQRS